MKRCIFIFLAAALLVSLPGCQREERSMRDGYYTAAGAEFDGDGWKPVITLYVYNGKIVTAEYDVINATGFQLDWDARAMRRLSAGTRAHPNEIVRRYIEDLLDRQTPAIARRYADDEYFYNSFTKLAAAAINQAWLGDKRPVAVKLAAPGAAH